MEKQSFKARNTSLIKWGEDAWATGGLPVVNGVLIKLGRSSCAPRVIAFLNRVIFLMKSCNSTLRRVCDNRFHWEERRSGNTGEMALKLNRNWFTWWHKLERPTKVLIMDVKVNYTSNKRVLAPLRLVITVAIGWRIKVYTWPRGRGSYFGSHEWWRAHRCVRRKKQRWRW